MQNKSLRKTKGGFNAHKHYKKSRTVSRKQTRYSSSKNKTVKSYDGFKTRSPKDKMTISRM